MKKDIDINYLVGKIGYIFRGFFLYGGFIFIVRIKVVSLISIVV